MNTLYDIIQGYSKVSLRIIDWFTTNYSKINYTSYTYKNKKNKNIRFNVYIEYKLQLKAYSKKRFDPFCRWTRINIPCKNDSIETTIGQLNFFKWALDNHVIEYIEKNYSSIEDDMNKRNSLTRKKDKKDVNKNCNQTRKKRQELSVSAAKNIKKEIVEITLEFD
jgi:hypothetical protein